MSNVNEHNQGRGNIEGDGNLVGGDIKTGDDNIFGSHNVVIHKVLILVTKELPLIVLALGLCIFFVFQIQNIKRLELKILDFKFRVTQLTRIYPNNNSNIIIIALRDDFLNNDLEGKPIDRRKLASLIMRLSVKTPKVIGLDMLLDSSTKDDEYLVSAIKMANNITGNIILPFKFSSPNNSLSPLKKDEIVPKFIEATGGDNKIGFVNFQESIDQVVRDLPLEHEYQGKHYYPFAIEILRQVEKKAPEEILEGNPEKTASLRINYENQELFHISNPEEIEQKPQSFYQNKIVLIGYEGMQQPDDLFSTPLRNKNRVFIHNGVFIHAQILNTIISKHYIHTWNWLTFIIVLLCAAIGWYLGKRGWRIKVLVLFIIGAVYFLLIVYLFRSIRLDLPFCIPILTLTLPAILLPIFIKVKVKV
jgi:CHASE2 domain-containing sensor protein